MQASQFQWSSYENRVLGILFLTFGFVFFDRLALNFLFPKIADEFALTNKHLGLLASTLALSWALSGVFFGWLSDRIGARKPLLIGAVVVFLSVLAPVFMIFIHTAWLMGVLVGLSYAGLGCFVLFMSTIPAETVSRAQLATALGLVMGTGEIAGGFLGPSIAGYTADIYGLNAPMWISAGGALVAAVTSLFLIETAPIKTGKSAANSPRPMESTMAA